MATEYAEITIDYVNARQDRRPASLKGNDGNYYTLSDEAYTAMLPWKGHAGQVGYYTNQKGFRIATHWNGVELPKGDPRATQPSPPTPAGNMVPSVPTPLAAVGTGQQLHPTAFTPPTKADFGYVMVDGTQQRTMPTVREQFAMKVAEAVIHSVGSSDPELLAANLGAYLGIAKNVWARTMEAPADPGDPANMPSRFPAPRDTDTREGMAPGPGYSDGLDDIPPPTSPDDYR